MQANITINNMLKENKFGKGHTGDVEETCLFDVSLYIERGHFSDNVPNNNGRRFVRSPQFMEAMELG